MDRDLKLSIIVPIYNAEQYLEECIDSLYFQDIPEEEYEIILINDGSTDSSYEIAKAFLSKHQNINLFTQNNSGQSVARNKGLNVAKGRYVMFVDSDDKLFPNVLGKLLSLAKDNRLDVCAYRIKYFDENGFPHFGSIQPLPPNKIFDGRYAVTHGADIGAVWLNLYSREMIEKYQLRFLEGIYHEDVDFNLQMYAYADRMMFSDIIAYNYRYVAGSSTRKPNKNRFIKLVNDNMVLVRHIRDFSHSDDRGNLLKDFYIKHGNSLIISQLLALTKTSILDRKDKLLLLKKLKKLDLYPIKGRTLSWKTTILKYLMNFEFLLKLFFR